jgi:uncharacterized protein YlxW (UPF0749 family)
VKKLNVVKKPKAKSKIVYSSEITKLKVIVGKLRDKKNVLSREIDSYDKLINKTLARDKFATDVKKLGERLSKSSKV